MNNSRQMIILSSIALLMVATLFLMIRVEYADAPVKNVDGDSIMEESVPTTTDTGQPTHSDSSSPQAPINSVTCQLDAKICSDGTAVSRTGPNCEFAKCPTEPPFSDKQIECTESEKSADACIEIYAPVCGLVEVQCVTTPCPPIPQTFSNSCHACSQGNVSSYSEGECSLGLQVM